MHICKPCVKYEKEGEEFIKNTYLKMNVTVDHRFLDGATAAQMLEAVKIIIYIIT